MSPDPGAQHVTQASGRTLTEMRPERRDALLTAIAKARGWIDDVQLGCIGSVAGIADCEVQIDGISLEALRKMLRGVKGRGCHCGAIGEELRRMGWQRERNWKKTENGFRAFWFPPS